MCRPQDVRRVFASLSLQYFYFDRGRKAVATVKFRGIEGYANIEHYPDPPST